MQNDFIQAIVQSALAWSQTLPVEFVFLMLLPFIVAAAALVADAVRRKKGRERASALTREAAWRRRRALNHMLDLP
jgi:hypothetical protein